MIVLAQLAGGLLGFCALLWLGDHLRAIFPAIYDNEWVYLAAFLAALSALAWGVTTWVRTSWNGEPRHRIRYTAAVLAIVVAIVIAKALSPYSAVSPTGVD